MSTSIVIDFRPGETAVGPQGPAGFQGPQGDQGYSVLSGTAAPTALIGVDNDLYIRTTTSELFKKITGSWVFQSSLLGNDFSVGQVDGGTPSSVYGGTFVVNGGIP